MIPIHHGTPAAVDARVREEFVEHLCLVNEDFNHEKRALLEENDALAAENVTLRKEADLYRAAEEMQIALREKMELQRDALAAFAREGITGLFESGLGWDADCIEEAALAYGLVFGEPYEPEGKHANNQCEIIEPGDTLLQMQPWVKEAGQRREQNDKHDQE